MSALVPYVVGVTGGIGSGKSTVCEEFAALGAPVIDTDQVAREVVAPGTPGLAALVAAFGQDILNDQGELDRRRMRQQVFANPALRQQLEAIVHPLIRTGTQKKIEAAGYPYCLVCIPLLVERGGVNRVDRVLVIDVPEAVQIARVIARDELTASKQRQSCKAKHRVNSERRWQTMCWRTAAPCPRYALKSRPCMRAICNSPRRLGSSDSQQCHTPPARKNSYSRHPKWRM